MKKVLRFLTLVAMLCIPWVTQAQTPTLNEGFESTTFPPTDWTVINVSGSSNWARNTSNGHESTAAAYIGYAYSGAENYLITPKLVPAVGEELSFYIKQTNASWSGTTITIEVSTTTATASAFTTVLATYESGSGGDLSTTYAEKTIDLSAYVDQEIYLAFHVVDDNGNNICVDDVTGVTLFVPTCPNPTDLEATITPGSGTIATLEWVENGSATAWTIEYSTTADFSSGVTQTTATGTPTKNLTGLTAEATYYARVKADCGGGDVSDWSTTVTFTPSNAYTITVNDGATTNAYVPIYGSWVDNITKSQFIIPATNLSSIQWATISEMTFYSSSANVPWTSAQFEVYMMETNETTLSSLEDWATMTKVMNAAHLEISGNQMVVTLDAPYQYSGGNLMIGVLETTSGSYSGASFYGVSATGASMGGYGSSVSQQNFLPKVTFAYTPGVAPSCTKPTGLAASNITSSSATLNWTAGGEETDWTVEYGTAADFAGATSVNVSGTPAKALSGLTPATTYYARVKAVCSGSDESDWSNPASFTTACATIAADGYTQNFDSYTTGNNVLPVCWSYINTTTNNSYNIYPKVYNYNARSASNCLYLYSYAWYSGGTTTYDPQPQYAILPEMTGLAGMQLTLWAKGYNSSSSFNVGIMTDPTDVSTFFPFASQNLTSSYQEFVFDIPAIPGNYLAIKLDAASSSRTSNGVYIDDISIAAPPTCIKPSALTLETKTAHTATLTWTDGADETDWQIAYGTSPSFDPASVTPVDVTTKPYTLTGLDANTTYYAYIRANCGGGDFSAWSSSYANFTTYTGVRVPTGLAVDDATLSPDAATVTWTGDAANDLHDSYELFYSQSSTNPTNETVPIFTDIDTESKLIVGLTPGTTYYVWVRDNCGADGISNWTSRVSFTTPEVCPAPTGVTVSSATAHGATISWTGTSDSYNVYVGKVTLNSDSYDFEDNAISPNFTNDATYPWTVTTDDKHAGTYSVKSGGYDNASSSLTLTVSLTDDATITFWDKISSEEDYDYGYFLIDGVQKYSLSGTGSWTQRTYDLTAGSHTLVWRYTKDYSTSDGDDCYYVDDITVASMDVASWERYEAPASPYVLFDDGNIDPETDYAVKVVGVCDDMESPHESAMVLFTTSADCDASNVAVDNIGYHSADITWSGSSDAGYTVMRGHDEIAHEFINETFTGSLPTTPEWTNDPTYPWGIAGSYIHSGNAGVASTTSEISVTVDLDADGYIEFDAECRGEGSSSFYDKCIFLIGDAVQFTHGEDLSGAGFVHYKFPVAAGTRTFKWRYTKDSSVDPAGDYFAIDNVQIYTTNIDWEEVETVDVLNYTFDGLEDGTHYYVKVSPECNRAIESDVAEFTTVALPTISVEANKWYAFSTPMHDAGQTYESVANVENLTTGTYDFLRYDEPTSTWQSQKSGAGHTGFTTLELGRGYIYRRSTDAVLKVDGVPNTGNIVVPITKAVDGWNLIGNPFMTTIKLNSTYIDPSSTAELLPVTTSNASCGYKLSTVGVWNVVVFTTSDIAAGEAVLVKASTTGTLILRPTASKGASAAEEESDKGIVFSVSNDKFTDVAYAMFADGEGLPKISHLNPEAPALSIGGYAVATLDENTERFPMSVSGQGRYTLALKENGAATGYLHLIDRATGSDIDLLATPEYSFVANGQADRFEVRLMPGMDENGNVTFVRIDGSRLIIDGEGELQVFDVMGRQLGSAQVSGTATFDRSSLGIVNAGVYVMRLDGNSQKIVVK